MRQAGFGSRRSRIVLACLLSLVCLPFSAAWTPDAKWQETLRFEIVVDESIQSEPVDGRILFIVSDRPTPEPRFRRLRSPMAPAIFGLNVEDLVPGDVAVIDAAVRGWPLESISELPAGEYYIQAVLNVYTTFHRSDGHTIKAHMDQWEGQHFNRSPGNLYSEVKKVHLDPTLGYSIKLSMDQKKVLILLP